MRSRMRTAAPAGALTIALLFVQSPAGARDVIYVPTPPEVVERMLQIAQVGPGDRVIDLGSGDGRIAIAAVRDFGADEALGIDIDPERIAESRTNARAAGVYDKVTFRQGDLFETDISDATVITMYLLSSINERLKPKLLSELKPGTRVVSHDFGMQNWEPVYQERIANSTIFLWTVPAQVDGQWQVRIEEPEGAGQYLVQMEQEFTAAAGTASAGDDSYPVEQGRIDGEQVSFVLENGEGEMTFQGRVDGDRMTGTVNAPNGEQMPWQAERVD